VERRFLCGLSFHKHGWGFDGCQLTVEKRELSVVVVLMVTGVVWAAPSVNELMTKVTSRVLLKLPARASLNNPAALGPGAELLAQSAPSDHNPLFEPSQVWAFAPKQPKTTSAQAHAGR
jgi:hypothetical protein